jgi:hypothetical protein
MPRYPQIVVSADLIDRACRADSSHCMIADAIKAQIPDAQHVSVDLQTIRYTRPATGRRYLVLTPAKAQLAIIEFDQGRPVAPFSLNLKPSQIIKSDLRKKVKAAAKKAPAKRAPINDTATPPINDTTAARGAVLEGPALVPESTEPTGRKQLARMKGDGPGSVPLVIGGHAPPVMDKAAHARGKRRQYGLRVLEK